MRDFIVEFYLLVWNCTKNAIMVRVAIKGEWVRQSIIQYLDFLDLFLRAG